jgi:hypothetical protein
MRDIFVYYYKVEIYYKVSFEEKDIAKSQKMLWNPKRKCWYKFYKYVCVELIDPHHIFDIKEIIGDIPDEHIEYIVIGIVLITTLPVLFKLLKKRVHL